MNREHLLDSMPLLLEDMPAHLDCNAFSVFASTWVAIVLEAVENNEPLGKIALMLSYVRERYNSSPDFVPRFLSREPKKCGRNKSLTEADLARAKAMYDSGMSGRAIGLELQCSRKTVTNSLRRIGVSIRPPGRTHI